jgi:hypothetical protein
MGGEKGPVEKLLVLNTSNGTKKYVSRSACQFVSRPPGKPVSMASTEQSLTTPTSAAVDVDDVDVEDKSPEQLKQQPQAVKPVQEQVSQADIAVGDTVKVHGYTGRVVRINMQHSHRASGMSGM